MFSEQCWHRKVVGNLPKYSGLTNNEHKTADTDYANDAAKQANSVII